MKICRKDVYQKIEFNDLVTKRYSIDRRMKHPECVNIEILDIEIRVLPM